MGEKPIYLDYNATTPIAPAVREAMLPYLAEHFGNPSSSYFYGQQAKEAVAQARRQVAALIGAAPEEIVFTSGGSESDNQAIIGVALANKERGNHIITSRIEHPAVLNTCRYLEDRLGFRVTYLPVDGHGLVDPDEVNRAITKGTILISIMHANNEVGTVEPIEEIGRIARERGILFHTDAAQSCGKIKVDVNQLNVDLLTIAGHKLYAPKGIGALFIRKGTRIDPFIHGAGQESGRRAGTENVPYMVGLGVACEIAQKLLPSYQKEVKSLRDALHAKIEAGLGKEKVRLNGHPEKRLPNTLNLSIKGIVGEELLRQTPEIAASTGAACHAGSTEPSSVLLEMGLSRKWALGALRLTLGRWTTAEEIDAAGDLIVARAKRFVSVNASAWKQL
ncbi:MAG TPA: aminotransferase class V-fold PLP-dependent enzyme [Dehalococcoidia bacterium]|nr:aminotransferase class V-fold PLP-dependent enzyme [Dehalococcoidia bacterium]